MEIEDALLEAAMMLNVSIAAGVLSIMVSSRTQLLYFRLAHIVIDVIVHNRIIDQVGDHYID